MESAPTAKKRGAASTASASASTASASAASASAAAAAASAAAMTTYGEAPVQMTSSSQHATPEELVAIARQIWQQVQKSGITASDDKGNDALYEKLRLEFRDFGTTFPIPLRWMVQARKYNERAFTRYLAMYAKKPPSTRESFLEAQAEYLVFLYREENRGASAESVRKYRAEVVRRLTDEDKEFTAMQKEAEAEIARVDINANRDLRERLYADIMARRDASGAAAPRDASGVAARRPVAP
jgi:hypothetical protein